MTKVNIDTDGRLVWTRVHREFFRDKPGEFDFRPPGKIFIEEYAKFIASRNQFLGSAGQLPAVRAACRSEIHELNIAADSSRTGKRLRLLQGSFNPMTSAGELRTVPGLDMSGPADDRPVLCFQKWATKSNPPFRGSLLVFRLEQISSRPHCRHTISVELVEE